MALFPVLVLLLCGCANVIERPCSTAMAAATCFPAEVGRYCADGAFQGRHAL